MKFIAAFVALVAASVVNAQSPTFTNCAAAPQMAVTSLTLDPYPLCINENVCATITGTSTTPIDGDATLAITGRYLGRLVYTDNQDLCSVLAASGHACPVPITTTEVTACILVKPNAPPNIGVALTITATNGDGGIIFCQTATVTAVTCP
ncbi:hypothetical protein EC957_005215 [Mortierella hygrophila]|uniref:Phosphatidylglycerol/phosphatidylinositol transfer protein n=1 Tax=Mortierella hygrophila TaxID=979708 RepID=A0A9P6F1A6_9FUNG|nr:hypothetical protein EC957_005215 [Mortierella hygrophila]